MKKGVTIVFVANIINMLFSVLTSFLLPKFLSIESYGYYKVYLLYLNYLGIAHIGFVDGVYLRYGGADIRQIDNEEILKNVATIRNMQIAITICALFVAVSMRNYIAVILALSCIPINMVSFYKNLFQATGEFKDYGIALSMPPMLLFLANIVLLFVLKTDDYTAYIFMAFGSNFLLYILLEFKRRRMFGKVKFFSFDKNLFKENLSSGITLTLGNFASIIITSIDRWCIQAWMTITDFSFYSFAVSVENLFNVCVSAVTTTLFNYLCKVKDNTVVIRIKTYCIFAGVYLIAFAFPIKYVVHKWLYKYNESINCLFLLVCAHSFYFVIKAVYVNLYKAKRMQRHYLAQMIVILCIAVLTNVFGFFFVSKSKEIFSCATLLTAILWYFICYIENKEIRGRIQETILLLICAGVYIISGIYIKDSFAGCSTYLTLITICNFLLCGSDFKEFVKGCRGYATSILKR